MSFRTNNASFLMLGAGTFALFSLSLSAAQTVPVSTVQSANGAVYTTADYTPILGLTAGYHSLEPVYVGAPTTATVIPPCLAEQHYQTYLGQIYGYGLNHDPLPVVCGSGAVVHGTGVTQPYATYAHAGYGQTVNHVEYGTPAVVEPSPIRSFYPTPVSVTTTTQETVESAEVLDTQVTASPVVEAESEAYTAAPSSRFRASASVAIDLGYQSRYDIQPAPTNLKFNGFSSLVIDRRNGSYDAQTVVEDPYGTLAKAYLNAAAPSEGSFSAEGTLVDQYGNSLEFYLDSDGGTVPVTKVKNSNPIVANGSVSVNGEYFGDTWSAGAAVGFDVSPIINQAPPTLSTANVYVNTRYGTLTAGRGVGLPYATRAYEVISGGGYSFADLGDYQASYVSPVVGNTRIGIVAGLQTRQLGATAEFQTTAGNNQYRAAAYLDTARSVQGEIGYTRALGNQRFVGATAYAGQDGSGESYYGIQGNVDVGRHSVQANATRVKSNNLTILYGSTVTEAPVLGIEINDKTAFNQQDQLNLEYRFQANANVQLYANAELINHKYYGSAHALGGGIRAAF
ncbi:MAG: hypothetical protein ACPG40_09575 [Alphaproteobacteria bacterium]